MKKSIIALVLFTAACGFLPSGKNYPYDMYDRDIGNVMKVLEEGEESGFFPRSLVQEEDDGLEFVKTILWGNVEDYDITDTRYVRMIGLYLIDVDLKEPRANKEKIKIKVAYVPNLGRVELIVREVEKIKQ